MDVPVQVKCRGTRMGTRFVLNGNCRISVPDTSHCCLWLTLTVVSTEANNGVSASPLTVARSTRQVATCRGGGTSKGIALGGLIRILGSGDCRLRELVCTPGMHAKVLKIR